MQTSKRLYWLFIQLLGLWKVIESTSNVIIETQYEDPNDRFLIIYNESIDLTYIPMLEEKIDDLVQSKAIVRCYSNHPCQHEIPEITKIFKGPLFGFALRLNKVPESENFKLFLVSRNTTQLPPVLSFLDPLLPYISYIEKDENFIHTSSVDSTQATETYNKEYYSLWHLSRVSNRSPNFNAPFIYSRDSQGQNVNVYVVDSGVFEEHEEFEDRARLVAVFTDDGFDDNLGHGTHVAGIIGSKTYGLAKKCNILAVKAIRDDGKSNWGCVIQALNWIYQDAIKRPNRSVVNLSIEGTRSVSVNDAIKKLVLAEIPVIASAGNSGVDACDTSPGSCSYSINVGATNQNDELTNNPPSNYGPCIGINAPGSNILSTFIGEKNASTMMSGTSMAAPIVTGIIAVYLSMNPTLSCKALLNRLKKRATENMLYNLPPNTPNLLAHNL